MAADCSVSAEAWLGEGLGTVGALPVGNYGGGFLCHCGLMGKSGLPWRAKAHSRQASLGTALLPIVEGTVS